MTSEPVRLSIEDQEWSLELAQHFIDACEDMPIICGIAALISVTGAVCYNEAEGDKLKAYKRAGDIAVSVIGVIDKLHQARQGNGDEDGTGLRD